MDMTNHHYDGEYTSALARCRRVLKKAGLPLYKCEGRYEPFGAEQKRTPGVWVGRVGVSSSIAIHAWLGRYPAEGAVRELEARALTVLREAGLPFDDRGWLECRRRLV